MSASFPNEVDLNRFKPFHALSEPSKRLIDAAVFLQCTDQLQESVRKGQRAQLPTATLIKDLRESFAIELQTGIPPSHAVDTDYRLTLRQAITRQMTWDLRDAQGPVSLKTLIDQLDCLPYPEPSKIGHSSSRSR